MRTVVITMARDFIAVKTVVITHEPGNPRQRRRSSWQNSAQLTVRGQKKNFSINDKRPDLVCKYSILRELRIITFSGFSPSN